ncbi:MAG TPA: PHP domain-containing protein [Gaiellaceae bacterium]|nr:PHP domain-containing protein [Gaiellaceae bacterium]
MRAPPPADFDNAAIADRLETLAALLDLAGAGHYSVRAYRRAAELVRATPAPVAELVRTGRVRELRGIGPAIETRLLELVETGRIAEIDELEGEVQPELVGLGRLVGLGPQRMVELGKVLGIRSAAELREAAEAGRLREAPGIGPSTEAKIRAALARPRPVPRRALTLNRAWALADAVARPLGGEVAGDPRRWHDSSEQLAVVVAATEAAPVLDRFAALPEIVSVVERSDDRAVGVTIEGVPVELVVASPDRFGTELMRATGSAEYVGALGDLPAAADEAGLYTALGLPYLPPELREQPFRGEPPALVELAQVRGDVHVHSTWSDGKASVLEMAEAARELGYEYVAICDHTRNVRVVPGLDADDVRRQGEEIARANEQLAPFRVLRGIECDILADGTLDLPDDVLLELDWVQASVHAGQRQSRDQLTKRTLAAVEHPAVRSISHPQGRILNHRPPNAVDLEAVFAACVETGTAVETNGLPDRIDLSSELVRQAIEAGVRITCSTDAHSVRGLANMQLSVATARRGWATAGDVLNTRGLDELLGWKRR